ncbi:14653_t:CDS:2 [Cetraspora pellucida]|uniref:14653_t:CDS:1 n=1 Tax=Cetraspora pellucida TaxID=1433469 RepID=A0A9N9C0X2_9GLOM|nr:14653_t:CDS:2 [Cetraspora pellucida]
MTTNKKGNELLPFRTGELETGANNLSIQIFVSIMTTNKKGNELLPFRTGELETVEKIIAKTAAKINKIDAVINFRLN